MSDLSIRFSTATAEGSYFPGQTVRGMVKIVTTAETKVESVAIGFLGKGEISTPPKYNEPDLGLETKKKVFFDEMKEVYNYETAGLPAVVMPGDHLFPFACQLPADLPASFESPQGHIRYYVMAIVYGTELDGATVHAMFTVNATADLNENRKANLPVLAWTRDESCMPCLRTTGVRAEAHIERRGYVPGEYMMINAEVSNFNRHPITAVKATLVQVIKYHHKSGPKKLKRNVCEVTRGPVLPDSTQVWREQTLLIPPIPATTLASGGLFSIWYKLYIFACPTGSEKGATLKLPVFIGTVPLIQHLDFFLNGNGEGPNVTNDLRYMFDIDPKLIIDSASPNFEPCVFGPYQIGACGDVEAEAISYSPLYASYAVQIDDIE